MDQNAFSFRDVLKADMNPHGSKTVQADPIYKIRPFICEELDYYTRVINPQLLKSLKNFMPRSLILP